MHFLFAGFNIQYSSVNYFILLLKSSLHLFLCCYLICQIKMCYRTNHDSANFSSCFPIFSSTNFSRHYSIHKNSQSLYVYCGLYIISIKALSLSLNITLMFKIHLTVNPHDSDLTKRTFIEIGGWLQRCSACRVKTRWKEPESRRLMLAITMENKTSSPRSNPVYQPRTHWLKGKSGPLEEGSCNTAVSIMVNIPLIFPPRDFQLFAIVTVY